MEGWQTVGARKTDESLFDDEDEENVDNKACGENVSLSEIVAKIKISAEPVNAAAECQWFSVLTNSKLELEDLRNVFDILELVIQRTPNSSKQTAFLLKSLNHPEVWWTIEYLLESTEHTVDSIALVKQLLHVLRQWLKLERSCNEVVCRRVATLLRQRTWESEHFENDDAIWRTTIASVKEFMAIFPDVQLEQVIIGGYPSGAEPPDDFRLIPVFPRSQDVNKKLPFLRPNIVKGPFDTLSDYLDIHYRLIREDYLDSLRKGIKALREAERTTDVACFKGSRHSVPECTEKFEEVHFKIARTSPVSVSEAFKHGTLVGLTKDRYKTFIFMVCSHVCGTVNTCVNLEACNARDTLSLESGVSYDVIVLIGSFFEAFRHTLTALSSIDKIPFESSILLCQPNGKIPKPWLANSQRLFAWKGYSKLNRSQLEAFQLARTQELCLIQGPPGTGKTFLGLNIIQSLLLNQSSLSSPILVVCYTNHALDQFLEGMLDFTTEIVRIGSRSKSTKLEPYTLGQMRDKYPLRTSAAKMRKKENLQREIASIKQQLVECERSVGLLEERELFKKHEISKLCPEFLTFRLATDEFLEVSALYEKASENENVMEMHNDRSSSNDQLEMYKRSKMRNGFLSGVAISTKMNQIRQLNKYGFKKVLKSAIYKFCKQGPKPRHMLTNNEKWRFYSTLHRKLLMENYKFGLSAKDQRNEELVQNRRDCLTQQLTEKHQELSKKLSQRLDLVSALEVERIVPLLASQKIIGMTTSGASQRKQLLTNLNIQIVVVEEAAEILEAHLIAILPKSCQQVILIGDHKQLPPKVNNHTLERHFNLGVSLFQRLVDNGYPYAMLNIQHRMKDHFLKLLVPHIYDSITSAYSVFQLEKIRGMAKDLQFFTHQHPENSSGDNSKSNEFEAEMIVRLVAYLLKRNYEKKQIVILAAYGRQQQELSLLLQRDSLSFNSRTSAAAIDSVRVSTIDDYQGEESEIVIVSFVRSNAKNTIGFLAQSNRVCVALSRAKKGLFCFGDFESYAKASSIWANLVASVRQMNALSRHLYLKCDLHDATVEIDAPQQFETRMPNGCCRNICNVLKDCGHVCEVGCHSDSAHPLCRQRCLYVYPKCGHNCERPCYQEHGKCETVVLKTLNCGHEQYEPCCVPSSSIICYQRCHKPLRCGHDCHNYCMQPCTENCMVLVDVVRDCNHPGEVACYLQQLQNTQQFCDEKLSVPLDCGHSASVRCRDSLDRAALTSACVKTVPDFDLRCGHRVTLLCRQVQQIHSYLCVATVDVQLHCGHSTAMSCSDASQPQSITLASSQCQETVTTNAECGHQLDVACKNSQIAATLCETPVTVTLDCGHKRQLMCKDSNHEQKLDELMSCCEERVFRQAPCAHTVEVACKHQHDANRLSRACNVVVTRTVSACQHDVEVVCGVSGSADFLLSLCKTGRTVELDCKHQLDVTCFRWHTSSQATLSQSCEQKVQTTLQCRHSVEQTCHGTLGNRDASCKQRCTFVLRCGHTCAGKCSTCRGQQVHEFCKKKCSKLLACGHPCGAFCGEPCPPCDRQCSRICAHGACERKCHEPCVSKSQACRRKGVDHCRHQSCPAKTCWECDCEPCKQKCNKKLDNCNHLCAGMCNEPCPPCFQCKPKKLKSLLGSNVTSGRYLLVPSCNHLVDVEIMDQKMSLWKKGTPSCPTCNGQIPIWRRYNQLYNRLYANHHKSDWKQNEAKRLSPALEGIIEKKIEEFSMDQMADESTELQMIQHFGIEILHNLKKKVKQLNNFHMCDRFFRFFEEFVRVFVSVAEFTSRLTENDELKKKTFLLVEDIFEDLVDMTENKWFQSVLDDIAAKALKLKCISGIVLLPIWERHELLNLITSAERMDLVAANSLFELHGSEYRIHAFRD